MEKISVNASKRYDIIIGNNLLGEAGALCREYNLSGKVAIISDSNVAPLYSATVKKSLEEKGFNVFEYVIESGESSKNGENFLKILNFLAENRFTRTDTVAALGGGVVGDLAGFCAASYMRGIKFVQMPTSLLAMVDSSVGGKTAIDLPCGKNLAGAFYQPELVICDTSALKTLPSVFAKDGMAEIIKYAMISEKLPTTLLDKEEIELEKIIALCVEIKRDVVNCDEFENGLRRILNFGHTAGHAIELLSNFEITHGHAVSVGMYIITNAWEKRGLCEKGTTAQLKSLIKRYNLPFEQRFSPLELAKAAQNDKKLENDVINLVVPIKAGQCEIVKTDLEELEKILNEGIE